MRLFNNEEISSVKFSLEEFKNYHQTAKVISQESISDYFYKLKDSIATLNNAFIEQQDKVVVDSINTQFETLHAIKKIKFTDFKDHSVLKPENFKGKYIDYIKDLVNASMNVVQDTETSLSNLNVAVASFINEYSEEKVQTLYGVAYFKESEKLVEKYRKEISAYFPSNNHSTTAYIGDILKSLGDVEPIYEEIKKLQAVINVDKIENLNKMAQNVANLIDSLIEMNSQSNILAKNDSTKKDLVSILYVAAKEVEFVSYLFSNAVFFYSAFKALAEKIVEFSNIDQK